uniref:CDC42 effector protein (Rho GTPase binding) 4b n=1 Tax=Electrophorus electricus TaxID=8005 RepID=A0AAY5EN07_ELEEL
MPILKQLVSGSSQAKRRSRTDLTAEMISAPLGDFRHTMHVGRGGDAFGDTSFLSSRRAGRPDDSKPAPPGGSPGYRDFGELTDLPVMSAPPGGVMKHAESMMSFHIDLGPSMLGDILSIMDRKGDTEFPAFDRLFLFACFTTCWPSLFTLFNTQTSNDVVRISQSR